MRQCVRSGFARFWKSVNIGQWWRLTKNIELRVLNELVATMLEKCDRNESLRGDACRERRYFKIETFPTWSGPVCTRTRTYHTPETRNVLLRKGEHLSKIPPQTERSRLIWATPCILRLWQDAIYEAPVLFIAYGPVRIKTAVDQFQRTHSVTGVAAESLLSFVSK